MTDPFSSRFSTQGEERPAGVIERFVARLLDGLIVGVPLGLVLPLLFGALGIDGNTTATVLLSSVVALATFAYFLHFESSSGQTVGKKVMGLTTRSDDGPLDLSAAFKRNCWLLLAVVAYVPAVSGVEFLPMLAALSIGVMIALDPAGRGWHDRLAGTSVIRAS